MDRGPGRLTFLMVMLALCVSVAARPAGAVEYGAVAVAGEEKPALYLEFKAKELRMAPTLEGLASAKPIKAAQMDSYEVGPGQVVVWYRFPETDLPISLKGVSRVRAAITLDRMRQTSARDTSGGEPRTGSGFGMECRVTKQGAGSADWTYTFYTRGSAGGENDPSANIATIPVLDDLKLTIETKIEGRKARIGLRPMVKGVERVKEEIALREVLRNGKPARASLEVTDDTGKVVHTQKGDLKKFGFT